MTDDVDGVFAKVQAAGANVVEPVHDTDYGSLTFAVRDIEGHLWTFGTYRGAA